MIEATARSRQDYRLVGGAGEQAHSRGLVSASWYKSAIPRAAMKELMRRSDREAIRDTLIWYALILASGVLALCLTGNGVGHSGIPAVRHALCRASRFTMA